MRLELRDCLTMVQKVQSPCWELSKVCTVTAARVGTLISASYSYSPLLSCPYALVEGEDCKVIADFLQASFLMSTTFHTLGALCLDLLGEINVHRRPPKPAVSCQSKAHSFHYSSVVFLPSRTFSAWHRARKRLLAVIFGLVLIVMFGFMFYIFTTGLIVVLHASAHTPTRCRF